MKQELHDCPYLLFKNSNCILYLQFREKKRKIFLLFNYIVLSDSKLSKHGFFNYFFVLTKKEAYECITKTPTHPRTESRGRHSY